ncbi:MAG TPA: SCO family protein [Vicinamibacterales bacterium]|nr:SCO family protein [Vicinamibacterales bacterium]
MFRRCLLPLCLLLGSGCAQRHEGTGLVLKIDASTGTVTVSHDAIPGVMDAMVMPFAATRPSELTAVRPGDRIQFRLNVRRGGSMIDRIRILSAAPMDSGVLQSPAAPALVPLGQPVPDFTLTDQDGRPLSLASLKGQVVAISFIYTRCPLPDYCPRVMTNLGALRDRFRDRVGRDLTLLTITFDPKYDTAETLKAYGARYGADLPGWRLLTGSARDIERVCSLFGVEFWPEEGMITHTLQTAIIDRQGRLAATVEGKDFSPRQLGDLVEQHLGK